MGMVDHQIARLAGRRGPPSTSTSREFTLRRPAGMAFLPSSGSCQTVFCPLFTAGELSRCVCLDTPLDILSISYYFNFRDTTDPRRMSRVAIVPERVFAISRVGVNVVQQPRLVLAHDRTILHDDVRDGRKRSVLRRRFGQRARSLGLRL